MKCLSPKLKSKLAEIWQKLEPYKDVIIFVIALFVSNGIWKLCIHGDEDNIAVTLLGLDVTAFFQWCSEITAEAVFWVVSLFRDTIFRPMLSRLSSSREAAPKLCGLVPRLSSHLYGSASSLSPSATGSPKHGLSPSDGLPSLSLTSCVSAQ